MFPDRAKFKYLLRAYLRYKSIPICVSALVTKADSLLNSPSRLFPGSNLYLHEEKKQHMGLAGSGSNGLTTALPFSLFMYFFSPG